MLVAAYLPSRRQGFHGIVLPHDVILDITEGLIFDDEEAAIYPAFVESRFLFEVDDSRPCKPQGAESGRGRTAVSVTSPFCCV